MVLRVLKGNTIGCDEAAHAAARIGAMASDAPRHGASFLVRPGRGPPCRNPSSCRVVVFRTAFAAGGVTAVFAGVLNLVLFGRIGIRARCRRRTAGGARAGHRVYADERRARGRCSDPFVRMAGCGEHVHEPAIQSTLVKTDTDMGLHNDLATFYECSEDGMVWTFKIRTDVKFTDGEPLTAEDVAFTINGIKDAPASEVDLSMVSEAVALDDETVEFVWRIRSTSLCTRLLPSVFALPMRTAMITAAIPSAPVAISWPSGTAVSRSSSRRTPITTAKRPPVMKRVVVVFMDEDASLAAAQAGQVDVPPGSHLRRSWPCVRPPSATGLLSVKTVDSRGISLPVVPAGAKRLAGDVEYDAGNDVTCDLALRRAMNYAVDRGFWWTVRLKRLRDACVQPLRRHALGVQGHEDRDRRRKGQDYPRRRRLGRRRRRRSSQRTACALNSSFTT